MDRPVAESNCAEVHDDLAEFALGVLEEHRRAVVAAHAERCAACAAEVTALTRSLDALLDSAPVADPPPGFAERTVAAAMTSRTDPAGERPTVVVPIAPRARRWWIATVAALVLALGAGIGLGSLLSSAAPRPASQAEMARASARGTPARNSVRRSFILAPFAAHHGIAFGQAPSRRQPTYGGTARAHRQCERQ